MAQSIDKKKVLFLITKSNWGGAQRYVYDLATTLPTDRFEVCVALGGNGELVQKLTQAGIRTIPIAGLQRDISLAKELGSFREIWRIVGEEQPDILHVNSSKAGGLGALVGRLRGISKIIYSAHGWAFNEARSPLSRIIVGFFHWLTIMLAHVTIAVSNATKAQMRWPLSQRKIVVVQNGRETPAFKEKPLARETCLAAAPELSDYLDNFWTGTIAELHPIKQHHLMIDAVAQLREKGVTVRHIIIGEGEARSALTEQINKLGLQEQVFLLGAITEAASLLTAFDVFVLPSRSEALGYSVIEAAQAGLPIVASKVGGIPEIISSGWNGLLLEETSAASLAEAVATLYQDSNLRTKLAHSALIRGRHFSLERMSLETTAIYNV